MNDIPAIPRPALVEVAAWIHSVLDHSEDRPDFQATAAYWQEQCELARGELAEVRSQLAAALGHDGLHRQGEVSSVPGHPVHPIFGGSLSATLAGRDHAADTSEMEQARLRLGLPKPPASMSWRPWGLKRPPRGDAS